MTNGVAGLTWFVAARSQNFTGTTGALPDCTSFGISFELFSHTSSIERLAE
jgi:hypothetical protein